MAFLSPEIYMQHALFLAKKGRNTVSPNPMVGCVIVRDNVMVGEGYHQRAGEPHAEIYALQQAGDKAHGSDVYVTLEPCCHYGQTPPCTNALIQAGVKRVFIACCDLNPLVANKGIQALNKAGIETIVGIHESEARALNKIFFHFIQHKTPFVIAKWAMSLDGKTITHPKDSRLISDEACRTHAHQIRQTVDAILIGANTAIIDNPQLTVRMPSLNNTLDNGLIIRQPKRIILSTHANLPLNLQLFSPQLSGETIVATTKKSDKHWQEALMQNNVTVWILPENSHGQIDLEALLKKCGENNITSLLVEGGQTVHQSFYQESLVQETQVYLSPVWIGKEENKKHLSPLKIESLGASVFITSESEYV